MCARTNNLSEVWINTIYKTIAEKALPYIAEMNWLSSKHLNISSFESTLKVLALKAGRFQKDFGNFAIL